MLAVIYCEQNLLFVHPDHLCFDRTTYDNINGPGGPFMFDIIGPAGPLMYPDQIFRYSTYSVYIMDCKLGWTLVFILIKSISAIHTQTLLVRRLTC